MPHQPPDSNVTGEGLGASNASAARSAVGSGVIGSRIGRYEIRALLGRGGMGEVYSAYDPELDRTVAIKLLNPSIMGLPSAVERFIREAKAASALNHPNIVTVFEFVRSEATLAIAMELVEGLPLTELCGTPQPFEQVIRWGRQIAEALAATHARGLVHRDIKPANIMVRPDGYLKVLDFGLARVIDATPHNSTLGRPVGTLRYMSPEQTRGETLTGSSDIFSLGLILFELATGKHPFKTSQSSPARDDASVFTPHPAIPRHLEKILTAMLKKQAQSRPSAAELVTALSAHTGQAVPENRWRRLWWIPALAALAIGAWTLIPRSSNSQVQALNSHPLTSRHGMESDPVISADGQWAAFLSAERANTPASIYIQRVGADSPAVLAEDPPAVRGMAWTPDGKHLTLLRTDPRGKSAIVNLSREGGTETHVASTLGACEGAGLDWSPDGKQLAFADCPPGSTTRAIYLLIPATSELRKVTAPPASGVGDSDPRFSPRGEQIAFRRVVTPGVEDVFVTSMNGGEQRAVTREGRTVGGLAWMPDGESIAASVLRNSAVYGLWRYPANADSNPVLMTQPVTHAVMPAISRHTGRLLWVSQSIDINIWRVPASGNAAPRVLVASTLRDQDPAVARDGRLAFRSVRSGFSEIWVSKPDGSDPVRLTSLGGPVIGTLSWSPDGKRIAFDSRPASNPDIYLLECDGARCGAPKRLTDHPSADVTPNFSIDGEHVYFFSDRDSRREIWTLRAAGGPAVRLTRNGGQQPKESPDGKWLYFVKSYDPPSLWRMPGPRSPSGLSPDAEEFVIGAEQGAVLSSASWAPANEEVFFAANESGTPQPPSYILKAYHTASKKTRRIAAPPARAFGLTVSPDLSWLLFCQADRSEGSIMVADGAR